MRRIIALTAALMMLLCACTPKQQKIEDPVTFYYWRNEATFGSADSVIAPETREASGYRDNLIDLLQIYLRGPQSQDLRTTFPMGTKVVSLQILGGTAKIELNRQFTYLSGLDLSIACACITRTLMDLSGCNTVIITAPGAGGETSFYLSMDQNDLLLIDSPAG